jgi:REP element-mobilizing transposase RayT
MPREVVPGRDYLITRRCSERRFFLRPDEETNNNFLYCLALAAQRAKVQVNFFNALSNHYHAGIHDSDGSYPQFLEHFHSLLARSQNAHLGRFENFWSSEPTSVVQLVEPTDIFDKMVYTFTNPTAADLVNTIEEWPGANSFHASLFNEEIVIPRPRNFFRVEGNLPLTVRLLVIRPRGFENLSKEEWVNLLDGGVREKETEHRGRRIKEGIPILGRSRVLAQDPFDAPKSLTPRFNLKPKVACKNKWARIEALSRNRGFWEKYRASFLSHMAGVANVVWPFGTYWMKKFGKVLCEGCEAFEASSFAPAPVPAPA